MEHLYPATLTWSGTTRDGYAAYSRTHTAVTPPIDEPVTLSADPHYRGDPAYRNPEQLLVLAASSCQMLSFLALAALDGVDVTDYRDEAVGHMNTRDKPIRVGRIELRPIIRVSGNVTSTRLQELVEAAHEECFIANSLRSEIVVTPTFTREDTSE